MQSAGHAKNGFSAKPMLRIVNMQRRLRPVNPGFGAIDFAIDRRDLVRPEPPSGRRSLQDADNFGI
jgi:hypothetical protein